MSEVVEMNISDAIDNKIDKSKWVKCKFSDLTDNIVEKVVPKYSGLKHYIGLEHLDTESLKIRRFGETSSLIGDKLKIYKGDLIFAKRNAYLKRVAIAEFEAVASAHSMVLRPKSKNVNPDFLPFFLMSEGFWKRAIEISVGSLSPTINWKTLAKQEFLLPPKEQQAQLAELLWAMDEVIERERKVLENCEALRDINREKLFTYGISALKDEDVDTKNGNSGKIPTTWDERRFSEIVTITSGQVDPKKEEFKNLFQIGSERIEPNTGKITEFKTAHELGITSGNYLFSEEHIIYSKIRPYFKKVANPNITGLCSADIYPLLPDRNLISKEFLFYYLLTEKFTKTMLQFQNRTGMPKVNRDELGVMYIPLPEANEQAHIVEILKEIDCSRDSILFKISSSKALQRSLINQIF